MIPVMPVAFLEKKQADELGLTQLQVRDALIEQAQSIGAHPHPEGLMSNGQPEVVYRTMNFSFNPPDGESTVQTVEGYCIWIEKDAE